MQSDRFPWTLKRFDELALIRQGLVDPKRPEYQDFVHVGPDNIDSDSGTVTFPLQSARDLGLISGKFQFQAGDILYSKIRPNLNKVAKATFSGLCSADMYAVIPRRREDTDPSFLFHMMRHDCFYCEAVAASTRSGLPKVNRDDIAPILLPAPALSEQRRIAAVLDTWDDAIGAAERLVSMAERRLARLSDSLFTSANDPEAPAEGWTSLLINDLADIVGGGTPSSTVSAYWSGGIPWCTPTDLTDLSGRYINSTARTISAEGLKASAATMLPSNSVVLCSRASVGECAINTVPMATNQGFQSLVPKDKDDTLFLYFLVRAITPRLFKIAAGSTFLEFGRGELRRLHIAAPKKATRRLIGQALASLDDAVDLERRRADLLRRQKRGLMQKLLTGDWRVPALGEPLAPGGPAAERLLESAG